jgi:hypothetical protein
MKAFFSITLLVVGVTAAQAGHLAGTGSRIIMFEGILSKVGPMLPPLPGTRPNVNPHNGAVGTHWADR